MADEIETQDDDVLELTDELEPEGEAHEPSEEGANDDEPEFAIELEGEEAAAEETPLVQKLRTVARDAQRELAEFRKNQVSAPIEVGTKPELYDEGIDGYEDKYDAALLAWHDRKAQAAQQASKANEQQEVRNREQQRLFTNYRAKAAALPVKNFDALEATVVATLPEITQSAIIKYANDPAKVVVALNQHPAKLAALAEESDPVMAIKMVWDMERKMNVVTRKRPPEPEASTIVRGTTAIAAGVDKVAERLLEKGDMQGYYNHMKGKRKAA